MKPVDEKILSQLWHDEDAREVRLREIVRERLAARPPPVLEDQVVATYFFALRTLKLADAVGESSLRTIGALGDEASVGGFKLCGGAFWRGAFCLQPAWGGVRSQAR